MTPYQRELEAARANTPTAFTIHNGLWGGWEIRWVGSRMSRIFDTKSEAICYLFELISPSFKSDIDKIEWIENLGEEMPQELAILTLSL